MTRPRWRWAAVLAYMSFIFLLSSIPRTPALPGQTDKQLHGLLYAGLAAVAMRAVAGGWRAPMTWAMVVMVTVLASAYGLSDEFHQSFVPGRQSDLRDVVADTVGALMAAIVCRLWSRWQRKRLSPGPV